MCFLSFSHRLSMVKLRPSSLMSTGCVVPLRGDCAIFCHAGSGRIGGVWSAGEKCMFTKFQLFSAMIAQWNSSLSVLPVAWVQFPATAEYFKGFFPGWSHSANPSWTSVAENGSISPQWHHTTCGQLGGRPKSNHGQMIADRKKLFSDWLK